MTPFDRLLLHTARRRAQLDAILVKVRVFSDIHLEHEDFVPPNAEADVVVLAGDVHLKTRALSWIRAHFSDVPVVYVPGNHEYYGDAIPRITDKLREAAASTNVHVLDNDSVDIDGTTFLGATLWTDFELFGDPNLAMIHAAEHLTDSRRACAPQPAEQYRCPRSHRRQRKNT